MENIPKMTAKMHAIGIQMVQKILIMGQIDGLKDKTKSGRPLTIPMDMMIKIMGQDSGKNSGWDFRPGS